MHSNPSFQSPDGRSCLCGPSDVNDSPLCSDSVVPGPGVRIPEYFNFDVPGTEVRFHDYCMAIYLREQAAKVAL